MFQPPVNNLEKIRKARKRVKQILLQIGLESCREVLEDYRSKPFCCCLCSYSTTLLSSFKNHLQRYHEEEKDIGLLAACPSCPFTSQSKTVLKHMRIFHSSTRKFTKPSVKENPLLPRSNVTFSCSKCSFTETLYYSMKKHVLMTHYETLTSSYFGEKPKEGMIHTSFKTQHLNKFYCKKCSYVATSQDALVYHILTSEKHRDLEQLLRTDILELSSVKRIRSKKMITLAPPSPEDPAKAVVGSNTTATISTPQDFQVVSFAQNGPNQPLMGMPTNLNQNVLPAMSAVPNSAENVIQKPSTTIAPAAQVGFLTAPMPQNQNVALQSPLSQSVFMSSQFPVNQSVNTTVFPQACNVNGQIISIPPGTVNSGVLPLNQALHGGLHPQSVLCPTSLHGMRPAMFPINQGVRPGNLNANQNAFLSPSIIRQLIPTGKQVNGIPTYTLITIPVTPCPVPVANQQKVPVQLPQTEKFVQASNSSAVLSSPSVISLPNTASQQVNTPAHLPYAVGKEAKQWKTCPVCNELFPSNVYEVHMQVAHIHGKSGDEVKEPIILAGKASFLKVMKDQAIRCLSCRTMATEDDLLKHLLNHGIVCLYCKAVLHELRNFVYHMKVMHLNTKKLHIDFMKKGIELARDANDELLFPHFNFSVKVSKEELGDRDIHLAVVAGTNSLTASPIYIKIQSKTAASSVSVIPSSKCLFCNCVLPKTEVYETHLKERHHIMPTLHTILKTPAFKCIHCCGVYTGSMTLSAIAVHLLRCRNAPKDSSVGFEVSPENNGLQGQINRTGMHDYGKTEVGNGQQTSGPDSMEKESVPYKRRRLDIKSDTSELPIAEDALSILALVPKQAELPYESKKAFLTEYFHVKPYPSKKEIELLATVLDMWKSDVASHFGMKRYMCLKFIKNHKYRVMLGFQMAELRELKHDLDIPEDY
ncbi:activity-dependent neuroprotector homeobox protein 2 isoform 2-T2 [Discoglossus pictus]